MDIATARAAALIAAAMAHAGQAVFPSDLTTYAGQLVPWILGTGPAVPAAQMTLITEGDPMPLTVDSVAAAAILAFEDDHGDKTAPPAGAVAVVTSSNTAILTAGAGVAGTDANGVPDIRFPLTAVAAGSATLSVHATAAGGAPLLGPDGITPIPDAAPVTVTVNPGAAAAEVFTVPGA